MVEVFYSCDSCLCGGQFVAQKELTVKNLIAQAKIHHARDARREHLRTESCRRSEGGRVRVYQVKTINGELSGRVKM